MTLRTVKSEDEEKSAVVHSTTQTDEYQSLEKERKIYCPLSALG